MRTFRLPHPFRIVLLVLAGWLLVDGFGGRFDPRPAAEFQQRASRDERDGLHVGAVVLSADESRAAFGVPLERQAIQPVWIEVRNDTDTTRWLLPAATDAAYFSPLEAAYRFHRWGRPGMNQAIDDWFVARQMPLYIPPHTTASGFVLTNLETGLKAATILLVGGGQATNFDFVLDVPGGAFLRPHVTQADLYAGAPAERLDLDKLRAKLAALPCCTTNPKGGRSGDPLNFVVVEPAAGDMLRPFVVQRWHLTEILDWHSAVETLEAFLFGKAYVSSPVSALYLYDRREDMALEKIRTSINRRNHLRLWLAPFTYEGRRVWVGQISQDIGVRFTDATWYLATHKIGPDVDFDRDYILQDLVLSGLVAQFGYVDGVGAATSAAPRRNLTGDPYFTDGLRLVIFLGDQRTSPGNVVALPWLQPAARK